MDTAKIHLSKQESALVINKEWILQKRLIMEKATFFLGNLHLRYSRIVMSKKIHLPPKIKGTGGKISRGENYNGLPFLILDFPALFIKENVFAVRTMFWWGNFFSITLHLSGKNFRKENVNQWLSYFGQKNFYISIGENEWEHDLNSNNFCLIKNLNEEHLKGISNNTFFKVAKKINLKEWEKAPEFLENAFLDIILFAKTQFPPIR